MAIEELPAHEVGREPGADLQEAVSQMWISIFTSSPRPLDPGEHILSPDDVMGNLFIMKGKRFLLLGMVSFFYHSSFF